MAVTWVNEFIKLCGVRHQPFFGRQSKLKFPMLLNSALPPVFLWQAQVLPFVSELLRAILPSVAAKVDPKLR